MPLRTTGWRLYREKARFHLPGQDAAQPLKLPAEALLVLLLCYRGPDLRGVEKIRALQLRECCRPINCAAWFKPR